MEDSDITILSGGKLEDVCRVLKVFAESNTRTFVFTELNKEDKRKRLWEALFLRLNDSSSKACHVECLGCLRMLSRDKTGLNDLIQEKWINCLLTLSGLSSTDATSQDTALHADYAVILEAQKCLSNLIYNSECAQAWCASSTSSCLPALVHRLRLHSDFPHDICLFDMKLLFLITATCKETRVKVLQELKGLTHLTDALERLMPPSNATLSNQQCALKDESSVLVCELLKTLFNIVEGASNKQIDEEEEAQFRRLVSALRRIVLCTSVQREELHSHCVHLLMATPPACYAELFPMLPVEQEGTAEQHDMKAIDVLLDLLEQRLKHIQPEVNSSNEIMEQLCPILTVLSTGALLHRPMRKHIKVRVLPPLREVHKRPEEVETMRGALCRLLTSPVTAVRDLAADLLFVLCKESVSRMVKHTGYGNCAGLLANRGLMLGGRGDRGHYSSESEDSDTEEYKEHRNHINPVIGCCEPPRPNPLANMSEEQKEHEAMQIVNMLDKLTRSGVVLPGRIGEDGKPEPLEHVLQLQECLTGPPSNLGNDQSDSD